MRQIVAYDTADPAYSDILTPACSMCGKEGWVTVPSDAVERLMNYVPIQTVLPELAPALREQIKTGIHPECWAKSFGVSDE